MRGSGFNHLKLSNNIESMKTRLTICIFLTSVALFGQNDETLFDDVHRIGAWGGPIFEYSNFDDDVKTAVGGGGALVLDDFYLGGYGSGKLEFTKRTDALQDKVRLSHGGFWLGYTPLQRKVIHPYTSIRFGWGKARLKNALISDPGNTLFEVTDNVFVLTPEFGIELNIFSFFRIAATANYRWVNGATDLVTYTDDDLSDFGVMLTLRFGGFGSGWKWD
jgi:hypothetical protein